MNDLHTIYGGLLPRGIDIVVYWFERSRQLLEVKPTIRIGLLATQSIRGGANRKILESIKKTGEIFFAWSDRVWKLDGAVVHVSMIAFDTGLQSVRFLDGQSVKSINADLTYQNDVTKIDKLIENQELCFRANEKGGPFDISDVVAQKLQSLPQNVNERPNSDVLKRWINAIDVTGRNRNKWIIDFFDMRQDVAAQYEGPFELLKRQIEQEKLAHKDTNLRNKPRNLWWLHRRSGAEMRKAVIGLRRFAVTIGHGKHRLFAWMSLDVLPSNAMYVFARDDDYFFGVLHSIAHEIWSRATGTQVRDAESGFRYTPTSCFDTFPFPWPPTDEPTSGPGLAKAEAIAAAARHLVQLRDHWLNPPNTPEADLKKRTLTNLYNARPTWLADAHRALDEAVFAAYGWPLILTTPEILSRLLALNHERAAAQPTEAPRPRKARRSLSTANSTSAAVTDASAEGQGPDNISA